MNELLVREDVTHCGQGARCKREVEASRFLATLFRTWTEQNVTVGEAESEGRRSRPRTTRAAIPHVSLLEEASEMVKTERGRTRQCTQ